MNDYYNYRYHQLVHGKHFAKQYYYLARSEAAAKLNFAEVDIERLSVLEFGCGFGQNIACLPNAWGYDVSELARIECANHGVKTYDELLDIPSNNFDIVLSRHCLEHIENPLDNLIMLRRFLKPNGKLILILPKERQKRVILMPDVHQHLYCWNFRAINNLLAKAGYEVLMNRYQSVVGYKALLPIRRILGKDAYYLSTRIAGFLLRVSELVIHAQKRGGK